MTFRFSILFLAIIFCLGLITQASAQLDSVIGQITNAAAESYAGGISGDGRFVVFESNGDVATENPRNSDHNVEIFVFDYAQRRIFQITDTKNVLYDVNGENVFSNVRISIVNTRPIISHDGKWIAFSSNATIAYPGDSTNPPVISTTNPGSFDGNAFTSPTPTPTASPSPSPSPAPNPLTRDANLEMWIYQMPVFMPTPDMTTGIEMPYQELAGGTFTPVTNTVPSQLPRGGTQSTGAFVADDNHDASISDDGSTIAFMSTRDLVPAVGNSFPLNEDNDEVFTYHRPTSTLNQITKTPRGPISDPIYNKNPTISGNGGRVVFASTGDNPIVGMTGGNNPASSRNEEIFYSDLTATGDVGTVKKQVTVTTPTTPGAIVNILDLGRRMSRDGNLIVFDSYADLANENGGTNYASFATYVYDATANTFRRVLPRSDADSGAPGGDLQRYGGFTDTDVAGTPSTLILETRMNIKADGTIPSTASEGLNPDPNRPVQLYTYPLTVPPANATFKRIAKFPSPTTFLASTRALTSDSAARFAFNMSLTELGGGNLDSSPEVYYMLTPTAINETRISANFATGASKIPVSPTVVPSPSPTATPTPTPTPSPSPTASPSPTPSPTPQSPPAVFGLAPGMRAIMNFQAGIDRPIVERSGVGSLQRSFQLPIQLSGVTMTINGFSCGLVRVSRHRIDFVVPRGLPAAVEGTPYDLVLNNNGTIMRTQVVLVPARPDVYSFEGIEGPGGRAKVYNVTNRVHTTEPFTVRTRSIRPFGRVPTKLRIYLTGFNPRIGPGVINVRIGLGTNHFLTILREPFEVEPGIYAQDVELNDDMDGSGDQPVVVIVAISGTVFASRLDDTAPRTTIL